MQELCSSHLPKEAILLKKYQFVKGLFVFIIHMLFSACLSFMCQLFVSLWMWHQVSSWLQASISLVPIHQGVQLRWAGTTLYAAAPDTPEQHVHTVKNGYNPGGGIRPCRGRWRCWGWPWKEELPVGKEEELHHFSPLGDHWMQRWQCENTKWRCPHCSTWGVLVTSTCMHTT